jgi:hypothetical protein
MTQLSARVTADIASQILQEFDVTNDQSWDFLVSLIASGKVPSADMDRLVRQIGGWAAVFPVETCAQDRHRREPPRRSSKHIATVSHFWADADDSHASQDPSNRLHGTGPSSQDESRDGGFGVDVGDLQGKLTTVPDRHSTQLAGPGQDKNGTVRNPRHVTTSPFFALPETTAAAVSRNRRPLRGTVSCLAVPPLSATRFGLIQEELSDDPFRLLIAVTFLIRTTGRAALPVFRQLVRQAVKLL